jgi:hypothetical protein
VLVQLRVFIGHAPIDKVSVSLCVFRAPLQPVGRPFHSRLTTPSSRPERCSALDAPLHILPRCSLGGTDGRSVHRLRRPEAVGAASDGHTCGEALADDGVSTGPQTPRAVLVDAGAGLGHHAAAGGFCRVAGAFAMEGALPGRFSRGVVMGADSGLAALLCPCRTFRERRKRFSARSTTSLRACISLRTASH